MLIIVVPAAIPVPVMIWLGYRPAIDVTLVRTLEVFVVVANVEPFAAVIVTDAPAVAASDIVTTVPWMSVITVPAGMPVPLKVWPLTKNWLVVTPVRDVEPLTVVAVNVLEVLHEAIVPTGTWLALVAPAENVIAPMPIAADDSVVGCVD